MATGLQATATVALSSQLTKALTVESPTANLNPSQTESFAFGTGANQGNSHYSVKVTVTGAGAATIIDLAGVVKDPFGDTITATKIMAIQVRNLESVAGRDLTVFGNTGGLGIASPLVAVASGVILRAKGFMMLCAPLDGYAVAAGAADQIELLAPGADNIEVEVSVLLVA